MQTHKPSLRVEDWYISGIRNGYRVVEGYGQAMKIHAAFVGDIYGQFGEAKAKADSEAQAIAEDRQWRANNGR